MIGSGFSKLAGESHQVAMFELVGLPPWFRALAGTFEALGNLTAADFDSDNFRSAPLGRLRSAARDSPPSIRFVHANLLPV
jgi:hypothetical protein